MIHPKVSVVIPAYNHERFIGPAIESVLQQTHESLELIIIDDGSTDRTAEVIQGYTDQRLQYVHQENQDAYNALNRGLSMVKGDFVAILNSDDIFMPNRLERLLVEQQASSAQCLFSKVCLINDDGDRLDNPALWWNQWYADVLARYEASGDLYTAFLQRNCLVTTSNLFMTREAMQTVGGFCPLRYLHDYDYMFRILLAFPGQVRFLHQEPLLWYRIHGSNTISEAAIIGREQDKAVIRQYLLARIPTDLQALTTAGIDRLVELEQELMQEHRRREGTALPGIRMQAKTLLRSCAKRLHGMIQGRMQ
ncbi:MAG: glycosyltransferase [Desulfobulbus sp.]|nr:glycosyltransferase [Desulfobulbaceae bacterium]